MGNYNDFDLDIKKVQGENDIGPASITTTIILIRNYICLFDYLFISS